MKNSTVLFVDDDPAILSALVRLLHKQPYEVLVAHSAEDAMDMLRRFEVDVVVSDEMMKGMRGTEFLSWVANHYPDTVRLVMTGQPSVPSMQTAINDVGVFRYLTKPVRDFDLAMTIRDALESRTSRTS